MIHYVRKIAKYTKINKTCNNCYLRRKLIYFLKHKYYNVYDDYMIDEIIRYFT